jgi:hypothetical protein
LKLPFQSGLLFLLFLQKVQNLFMTCLQGCQLLLQITIFCNKWTNFRNETGWQAILAQSGTQDLVVQLTEASLCEQLAAFPPTLLSACSSTDQWLLVDYSHELTFLSCFGAMQQKRQFSVRAPQFIL